MACHGMPWHGMACHGMACHGMAWHAMACHGMACHAMPWQHGHGHNTNDDLTYVRRNAYYESKWTPPYIYKLYSSYIMYYISPLPIAYCLLPIAFAPLIAFGQDAFGQDAFGQDAFARWMHSAAECIRQPNAWARARARAPRVAGPRGRGLSRTHI